MPGQGTTGAIFIIRQVQEKYQAKNKKLVYAFVDLEQAFERVPGEVVRWVLKKRCGCVAHPHSYGIVYRGLHCS